MPRAPPRRWPIPTRPSAESIDVSMARPERNLSATSADRRFMQLALHLADRVQGTTAPNPAVGAVIVDEVSGEVIARGWTQPGGRPHAETCVIEHAGARARGATMYVTLEPCSHYGHTPPCVDAITAAGLARVVCAIEDPDPRVSGRGVSFLRKAGVKVDVGVRAEEARWMVAGHILRMTQARPFVQLKIAASADGLIAPGHGAPTWVTGPDARALAHLMRARADAVLVGRRTVIDDDPELTCRLPGLEDRSPRRVVLARDLRVPSTSKLVQSADRVPLTIIGSLEAPEPDYPRAVEVRRVALGASGVDLPAALGVLHADGITRLLVEGGPTVARSFLDAGLVDEAMIFRGSEPIGGAGLRPLVDRGLEEFADTARWQLAEERGVGPDRVSLYHAVGRM